MGSYDVAGTELKTLIKVAKKGPIGFGFSAGKTDEETYCGMHRTKSPAVIGKEAKEQADGPKFTFGTVQVAGKVISLSVVRPMPGLAKKFKRFLKSQKISLNVQILDEDGNLLEDDIEDGLPDDPDLEDDAAAPAEDAPPEAPAAPAEAAADSAPDKAALMKRLGEMRARIVALPPEMAARLADPFRQVVDFVKADDLARAAAGADRIDIAIARLAAQPQQAAADATPPPAPPASPTATPANPEAQKLGQIVDAMRAKAASLSDDKTRTAVNDALGRIDALIAAQQTEAALTILRKVQQLLAGPAAAQSTAPADPKPATAAETWDARFRQLEPQVNAALTQGLVADVDGLRTAWDWAVGNAADGAHDKAVAALPRITALLAAAAPAGKTAFEATIAPDAQPFAKARVLWAGARATMLGEVQKLEQTIIAACAGQEALADVPKAVSVLTGNVARLDQRLETKMDEIVNALPGPDRERLKADARTMIAEYQTVLQDDFFKEVDGASGFGTFAVTSTATAALAEISGVIA